MQVDGDCNGASAALRFSIGDARMARPCLGGTADGRGPGRLSTLFAYEELRFSNMEWRAGELMARPSEPEGALLRMNR